MPQTQYPPHTPYGKIQQEGIAGLSDKQKKFRDFFLHDLNCSVVASLNYIEGSYREILMTEEGQTIQLLYTPGGGIKV